MRIFFKHGDGLASMDVENPQGDYLEWSRELEEKFESLIKPGFNADFSDIIEAASEEEINEASKEKVPPSISQMKLRKQLILSGISIKAIDDMISKLPQPSRDLIYTMWEYAVVFDRGDTTLNSMAQMLNISNEQLDAIFIEGNKL